MTAIVFHETPLAPPQRVEAETAARDAFEKTTPFIAAPMLMMALGEAFEREWFSILSRGPATIERLMSGVGPSLTAQGATLILMLLERGKVLRRDSLDRWHITAPFTEVLRFRRLLQARIWFTKLSGTDLVSHFDKFVSDPPAFMAHSLVFGAFRYDLCLTGDAAGQAAAREWVAYTSALTEAEAFAMVPLLGLERHKSVLDVGGNSGELALAMLRHSAGIQASVFDLPAVCALGRQHVADAPVTFIEGDLRHDPLPSGFDLITFKSILHDWPEADALMFLEKAAASLPVGGRIAIFERVALSLETMDDPTGFDASANLVFQPFYRKPDIYRQKLRGLGLREVACKIMRLDVDFVLIIAEKQRQSVIEAPVTPYPGSEICADGRDLLAAVEGLGCDFGYEHSAKFTQGGVNQDRFVISLSRNAFGPDGPREFCLAQGAPAEALDDLLTLLPQAQTLHLGFEGGTERHGPRKKLYLEFPVGILPLRDGSGKSVVFDALKWESGGRNRRDNYRIDPQERDPLDQLSRWDQDGRVHPAARFARDLAGDCDPAKLTRVDVVEAGKQRLSFDLNLYRLAISLDAAKVEIYALAEAFAIERDRIEELLAIYGQTRLGHIAGGIGPDGLPFATVYFGLQGRRGDRQASLLLPDGSG